MTNNYKTEARFVYPASITTWRYDTDQSTPVVLTTQTQAISSIDSFVQPLVQIETLADVYVFKKFSTAVI